MSAKKISIIIPCYNVEKYIDRCFRGLLSQTLGIDNVEVVIVDDASTDNTVERIKLYEEKYPESIVLIELNKNVGQGAARNVALQYASAEYIGFVDSDDSIEPDMFRTMLSVIEEYKCDFVECDWDFFSDNKEGYTPSGFGVGCAGYYDFSNRVARDDYISKQLFFTSVWNKVFRKSFLLENEIHFIEGVKYEDMYYCFLTMLYSKSCFYIDKSYYHYFLNPKGTVQQRRNSFQFDIMDVAVAFLQTTRERNIYEKYNFEVDWMFIEKYYVYMIWDLWDVFQEQAYDYYMEMKKNVKKIVPNYKNNPFRIRQENKMDDAILKLIDMPLSKEEFENLMNKLWQQQHK